MPPEKQTPIGSLGGNGLQPLRDLFRQRGDVGAANLIKIGGQSAGCGRKEARVDRIGIGASDELQLDDVVCRHHARVAGVKLRVQTFGLEPVEDRIDAVSHDQRRALSALGQKIAHGPVERTRHFDRLARPREQGERTLNSPHGFRRMVEQELAGVVDAQVVDLVCIGVRQVDDSFNVVVHNQPQRECAVQTSLRVSRPGLGACAAVSIGEHRFLRSDKGDAVAASGVHTQSNCPVSSYESLFRRYYSGPEVAGKSAAEVYVGTSGGCGMAHFERIRDVISGPFSPEIMRQRTAAGWQLVSIEWRRELPEDEAPTEGAYNEEIPYGLRISDDCLRLEPDPRESQALTLMMELMVQDFPISSVASDLNEKGFRTRTGKRWSPVTVFNMLPRLIEVGPRLFSTDDWEARRQKFARFV